MSVDVRVGAVLLDAATPFDVLGDGTGSACHADPAGRDLLWAGDHLLLGDTPLLDSALTLAAAAAVTSTITIRTAVLLPSLHPLAWAGRQVATLAADHLPAGCSWASEPAPADSRSTARRVSYAVTKGGDTD